MNLIHFLKHHKLGAIFIIAAIAIIFGAGAARINNQNQAQTTEQTPSVSLILASDYLAQNTVSLDSGTVQSAKQTSLKAQISAQIVSINANLGDNVSAGQTIAKLQDRDIAAQSDQARARLEELEKGARPQDIQLSQTSSEEAKSALINSIKDAYAKADDAIHNHIDKFFANPRQSSAEFLISINVSGTRVDIYPVNGELARRAASQKYALESMFSEWQKTISTVVSNTGQNEIETAGNLSKKNLQTVIDFANTMAPLVNDLSSDNAAYKQIIDGYKSEFSAARSTASGALNSLQGAQTAWLAAGNALELKLAGASDEQIRQARATVEALQAALAKTAIIAPISGKISYIAGNIGELAMPGQLIASIVNPTALQVKTYASEIDLPRITIGDYAEIDGGAQGTVSNISPAIDPQTKKIEVIIAITKNAPNPIVIGQNVSVKINAKNTGSAGAKYLLPIQAIQFTDNGNYALFVEKNLITRISVQTGELIGENIQITGGLDAETKIVSSVRGLKEGDSVTIQE